MTGSLAGLAAGGFHMHKPHVWFTIPGINFPVDNLVVAEWVIGGILIILAIVVNRLVTTGRTNRLRQSLELLLDFLEGWYASFMGGRKNARRFLPLLGTLFLFILMCNYLGLFPTVGYPGSLFAPTARWGTTLGLAIFVTIVIQVVAIRELGGVGWLKHVLHLGPLSVMEEWLVRPFSLSLRLFGNIFGEETLLAVIMYMVPYLAPVPIMFLSLLFGLIQAIVFTTLTAIYLGEVLEAAEAHGHGHAAAPAHGHGKPAVAQEA
ncbi:MAG TPA: FoF1 ATP synthase subunit a [Symbiobacteriaceae bacterium]